METIKTEGTMYFTTIEVELLSENDIAQILPQLDEMKKWIANVEKKALETALEGKTIPGYVLGEGRVSRKITDELALVEKLYSLGFTEEKIYETKLLGIPALEKLLGKKNFQENVGEFIIVEPGKPILVKETI